MLKKYSSSLNCNATRFFAVLGLESSFVGVRQEPDREFRLLLVLGGRVGALGAEGGQAAQAHRRKKRVQVIFCQALIDPVS